MTAKEILILCLVVSGVSVASTRYLFPQIRVKTVEVEKDVVHNDIQTVVKTVTLPSGEVDSTTTTVDHSQKIETDSKTSQIATIPPNWLVNGFVSTDSLNIVNPAYGIQVNRRILGPVFIGSLLSSKGQAGLTIGLEF